MKPLEEIILDKLLYICDNTSELDKTNELAGDLYQEVTQVFQELDDEIAELKASQTIIEVVSQDVLSGENNSYIVLHPFVVEKIAKDSSECITEIEVYRTEQSNMRSHLQKWHHIFFSMDNSKITIEQAVAIMRKLYLSNPYKPEPEDKDNAKT